MSTWEDVELDRRIDARKEAYDEWVANQQDEETDIDAQDELYERGAY